MMSSIQEIFVKHRPEFIQFFGKDNDLVVVIIPNNSSTSIEFTGKHAWHDAALNLGFRFDKPHSNWKGKKRDDKIFYTISTQYGVKYKCKFCGKENLGLGSYNHWKYCIHHHERGK